MNASKKWRLGVLLSGRGSNFSAIQEAIEKGQLPNTEVAIVVSNHTDAGGLTLAQSKGLKTATFTKQHFENRVAFDRAVAETLQANQVDLVILAGYDRIISAPLLEAYPARILNIHPSLLPAYGGKGMVGIKVHEAVVANREAKSGCTVHIVTDVVDGGAMVGQRSIPVLDSDTPETLAARILEQEHQLYPQAIREFIAKHVAQEGETDSYERNALV